MMAPLKILPARSGGRGTMRSMVEGRCHTRLAQPHCPSTAASRRSPSPQVGRI